MAEWEEPGQPEMPAGTTVGSLAHWPVRGVIVLGVYSTMGSLK